MEGCSRYRFHGSRCREIRMTVGTRLNGKGTCEVLQPMARLQASVCRHAIVKFYLQIILLHSTLSSTCFPNHLYSE